MFSAIFVSLSFLVSFYLTEGTYYCGSYSNREYCYPDDYQESYCCGYNDDQCCYYTNVAALWWFWLLIILAIIFFATLIGILCRRRRLQQRQGYVVVRGQNYIPGSVVVTQSNTGVTQVQPPRTGYAPYYGTAPPYQGYPNNGGEISYGRPPPYAPPNAPPNEQK